ncbi:MAG: hypothetical protein HUJ31_07355 [Pseudomonadales bacterium]|nr:hypothetical protein [Pseudomonadales bacterium]
MSDELRYRIIFDGTLTGEFDLDTTKKRFAKLFKLDTKRTEALFSGKEQVIKDNITEDTAMKFAIRIAEAGCECYIESVAPDDPDIPESGERRRSERRLRWRRGPRPGAIVPDRRLDIRRKKDQQFMLEAEKRTSDLPVAFWAYKGKWK